MIKNEHSFITFSRPLMKKWDAFRNSIMRIYEKSDFIIILLKIDVFSNTYWISVHFLSGCVRQLVSCYMVTGTSIGC